MTDEKSFSQDEVDSIIKERLSRQKKQHDEEIKETADALKATQAELQTLRKAEIDAALAEIAILKDQCDPAVLELLPDELSAPAQLTWLRKAAGQLPAQPKSKTPKTPIPKVGEKEFVPLPPSRKLA